MSIYDYTRLTTAVLFMVGAGFMTWGAFGMRTKPQSVGALIAAVWLLAIPGIIALVVLTPL